MHTLEFLALFVPFLTCVSAASQIQVAEAVNGTSAETPLVFPDGSSIRLETTMNGQPQGSDGQYRLIFRNPDGRESLVWNPPAWQPDYRATRRSGDVTRPIKVGPIDSAAIDADQLGVIVLIGGGAETETAYHMWVRWDRRQEQTLPITTLHAFYYSGTITKALVGPSEISVVDPLRGKFRLRPREDGRLMMYDKAHPEGRKWPHFHKVFIETTAITYGGEDNEWKVWKEENTAWWPAVSRTPEDLNKAVRTLVTANENATSPDAVTTPVAGPQNDGAGTGASLWLWLAVALVLGLGAWFIVKRRK